MVKTHLKTESIAINYLWVLMVIRIYLELIHSEIVTSQNCGK